DDAARAEAVIGMETTPSRSTTDQAKEPSRPTDERTETSSFTTRSTRPAPHLGHIRSAKDRDQHLLHRQDLDYSHHTRESRAEPSPARRSACGHARRPTRPACLYSSLAALSGSCPVYEIPG